MKNNYITYKADKLILDEFFIKSILHPTQESIQFWNNICIQSEIFTKEFLCAKSYVLGIKVLKNEITLIDRDNLLHSILEKTIFSKKNKSVYLFQSKKIYFIVASIGLLILLGGVYVNSTLKPNGIEEIIACTPANIEGKIQVILPNNKKIEVAGEKASISYDENKKGIIKINKEVINSDVVNSKNRNEIMYNQLIVPAGKQSNLLLADGTYIYINAGTRIIYPTNFEDNKREIYIDGEAYLDVAKNKDKPFIIKTPKSEIKVLGTSFNVTAYKNDPIYAVVLVKGSVEICEVSSKKTYSLSPNQMFYQKDNEHSTISTVDVRNYISWKEGVYIFNKESLENILSRISHYYGIPIKTAPDIKKIICSGKLELKDELEKILNGLTYSVPVKFKKSESGEYNFSCIY